VAGISFRSVRSVYGVIKDSMWTGLGRGQGS